MGRKEERGEGMLKVAKLGLGMNIQDLDPLDTNQNKPAG